MKNIIVVVVCFHVALLPTQILGNDELIKELNEIAEAGQIIAKVFQPSIGGYLGKGRLSIAYKGTLPPSTNVEVAMKFIFPVYHTWAHEEFEAYRRLYAMRKDDNTVEAFGIPSVSHYGVWKRHTLIALTLLDANLEDICKYYQLREMDILFVCREFVRILKYIHERGVLHNRLSLSNIMFRNNRVFFIGFGSNYRFSHHDDLDVIKHMKKDLRDFISEFKRAVEGQGIESNAVSRVISRLLDESNADQRKLNYNGVYEYINHEINGINHNGTVFFSWLTEEQKREAMQEPIATIDSTIESIGDPSGRIEFRYPEINHNNIAQAGTSSGGSRGLQSLENDFNSKLHLGRR